MLQYVESVFTLKLRRHYQTLRLEYVESVFTFSDTNKTATNGEAAWQSHRKLRRGNKEYTNNPTDVNTPTLIRST